MQVFINQAGVVPVWESSSCEFRDYKIILLKKKEKKKEELNVMI
jgi:hypothetical protein